MKYLALLILLTNVCWARTKGNFGAGIVLGSTSGFSVRTILDERMSVDGAFAFDLDDKLEAYATFLIRENTIGVIEGVKLDLYYGIGGKYENHDDQDDFLLGPRVPVGLSHMLEAAPVEIALEISGYYALIEDADFDLEFGLLGRYYF